MYRHNNTKSVSSPIPARFQTPTISTISFQPATRKTASPENTTQLRRRLQSLPSIIPPRITIRRGSHVLSPKRRAPLPDIPRHVVTSIYRASLREQSDGTRLVESHFFGVGSIGFPGCAPGVQAIGQVWVILFAPGGFLPFWFGRESNLFVFADGVVCAPLRGEPCAVCDGVVPG
jgi:hypothetical protein